MDLCITEKQVKKLLNNGTITFRNGRITYKNRDILFYGIPGNIINTNINTAVILGEPIFENVSYSVNVRRNGTTTEITFPPVKLYIKVVTGLIVEKLEVFSFENSLPLTTDNQFGTIYLWNGSISTVTTRWTYNYGTYPSIVDQNKELANLFSASSSSEEMLIGTSLVNNLPESYYDNAQSHFNFDLTSNIGKISPATWRYTLPKLTVTFGDKPETTYTIYFEHNGFNYIDI